MIGLFIFIFLIVSLIIVTILKYFLKLINPIWRKIRTLLFILLILVIVSLIFYPYYLYLNWNKNISISKDNIILLNKEAIKYENEIKSQTERFAKYLQEGTRTMSRTGLQFSYEQVDKLKEKLAKELELINKKILKENFKINKFKNNIKWYLFKNVFIFLRLKYDEK